MCYNVNIVALQFLYMLSVCLILELLGGILALVFRNQVKTLKSAY